MEQLKLLITEYFKIELKEYQIKDPFLELSVTKIWGIGDVNWISEEQLSSNVKCRDGTQLTEKKLLDKKVKEIEYPWETKRNRNVETSWPEKFDERITTWNFSSKPPLQVFFLLRP